jgi:hypothetical protein
MGRGRDGAEWEEIRIGKEAVCRDEERAAPRCDRDTNCDEPMCTECTIAQNAHTAHGLLRHERVVACQTACVLVVRMPNS